MERTRPLSCRRPLADTGEPDCRAPELRVEIDRIDQQMVQLFEERMQVVAEVMAVKKAAGLPILDASREEAVVAKNTARLSDPALADYYERLIRQMMALSREYQAKLMEA